MKTRFFMAPTISFDPAFEFTLTLLGDPEAADEFLRPLIWEIAREPAASKFAIVQMPDVRLAVFSSLPESSLQRIAIFFRQSSEGMIEMKRLCVEMKETARVEFKTTELRLAA